MKVSFLENVPQLILQLPIKTAMSLMSFINLCNNWTLQRLTALWLVIPMLQTTTFSTGFLWF